MIIQHRRPINLATVDRSRPLSDHPRNRGVVAVWLALAPNFGGPTVYDLTGRYHGSLPGAPTSGAGVVRRTASRANGYGEIAFDEASQQFVSLPDMTSHFAAEEATLALWIRFNSASPDGGLGMSGGLLDFGTTDPGKQIAFPFTDGNIYVSTFDVGRPISAVPKPPNMTSWNHLVFSSAAGTGNYKMYWNGDVYTSTDRTVFYMPTAPNLGKDHSAFYFDGQMDDVWLVNRAWSDAEVKAHYLDSLAMYRDALRRTPAYVPFAAAAPVGVSNRVGAIGYAGNYAY